MNTFRREGEYWTVEYQNTVLRLRDAKGLQYLAHLLQHPGLQFAALDLLQLSPEGAERAQREADAAAAERARSAVSKRIKDAIRKIHQNHPTLGRYLSVSVKTGHTCGYLPDPQEPVQWSP
jgi:hypothetical protein